MNSKSYLSLAGILVGLALALSNFGCGGGEQTAATPPANPPPSISVSVSPDSANVQAGGTQQFTATVTNDPSNKGVTWTLSPATGSGTLSNMTSTSVTYNAPGVVTNNVNVTITATSVADATKAAFATVTAEVPITISLSPARATLQPGGYVEIIGTINDNSAVTWSISPASGGGSLSEEANQGGSLSALYTAPATIPSRSLSVTIKASSVSDPTKSASISVTVTTAIFVTVSSTSGLIQVNGTVPVSAGVGNDPTNAGVAWSVGRCTGGTSLCGSFTNVNNSGSFSADYVAPATVPPGGQVTVVATSVTNPAKSASTPITVSPINFTSQDYPAGNSPNGIAVADFNGDGKLDIVVADYGNPSTGDNGGVSILLGNGDGTFKPAQLFSAGKNPISVAVGDFNNDGKQDLLVTDYGDRSSGGSGNLTLLLGNGDGTFQTPVTLTAGPEPFNLALGDFNNDGRLDFAVTDVSAGVYVFLGNGNGTFLTPALFSSGNSPVAIAAADLNRDGKLDLAVAGFPPGETRGSTVGIMLGNGDGTFAVAVDYPVFEDLGPTSIAAGDLNGDGKTDLAVTTSGCGFYCGSVTSTMLGNGDGTFQPVETVWSKKSGSGGLSPLSIHVADFSGNGKADLVQIAFESGASLAVFPGNGDGTFQGTLFFGADQGPLALAIGDFNGDGKPDIVVANSQSNDITVLLNASVP